MNPSTPGDGNGGEGKGEGEGDGGNRVAEIVVPADRLEKHAVFNLLKEIIGFLLYVHHQIPSVLQHMEMEFEELQTECKILEDSVSTKGETRTSLNRKQYGKLREVKRGIRRWEKLMNSVNSLLSALQLWLDEILEVHEVILILGASPLRPLHVYKMCFSHGKLACGGGTDCKDVDKSRKLADVLSRKAIRALVAVGAGGISYSGPMKFFVLVKAPVSVSMPLQFLPRRDFKYSKKILPFRLNIKHGTRNQYVDASEQLSETAFSADALDDDPNEMIWYAILSLMCGSYFCLHCNRNDIYENPWI
ncbi:hypothetical protein EJ110_NYTH13826 [Nymphaea thermarum]|nr:hypothetical protein EJ110_NYTH13826 [Nymphaea thermarum]